MAADTHDKGRILVVDDAPGLHAELGQILGAAGPWTRPVRRRRRGEVAAQRAVRVADGGYQLDAADRREEAVEKVRSGVARGTPYAVVFVALGLGGGWDGLRTIEEIWGVDPEIQVVVCCIPPAPGTGPDERWEELAKVAQGGAGLVLLRLPLEALEVERLAAALTAKWSLARQAALKGAASALAAERRATKRQAGWQRDRLRMDELEAEVDRRTEELRKLATHDELTGLPNRALLHDRLAQALGQAQRDASYRVALLFIDFDRFKVVNDSLGHAAGDALLRGMAERLAGVLRSSDTLARSGTGGATAARLGGDEFCVLLTGMRNPEDPARVAGRVLEALSKPYDLSGRYVQSTASIGISVSTIGYERAEDMMRDADTAMYRAKAAGRGRFVIFDRVMHDEAMERLTIENDLLRAIERKELCTFFQPVVSLVSGETVGMEALVRWERPERGLVCPVDFIKVAEETGFIDRLGYWVLEDACRHVAGWKRRLARAADMTVSVNVSKKQLEDPDFNRRVREILQRTGLPGRSLILELTETVLMASAGGMGQVLTELRGQGVRTFLDDFGTGYSSLSVVHTFPLDGLKIDRSFITGDQGGRRRYTAMLHTLMSLVRNLEIEAVAEGVESLEQVALLQSLNCVGAQGYLFSPPVAAEALEMMLRQPRREWGLGGDAAA